MSLDSSAPGSENEHKISKLIEEAERQEGLYFAVEYFPPRTSEGLTKLYERSARIATQSE
jgi:5,10-methylenetetrahydrofolate reductase